MDVLKNIRSFYDAIAVFPLIGNIDLLVVEAETFFTDCFGFTTSAEGISAMIVSSCEGSIFSFFNSSFWGVLATCSFRDLSVEQPTDKNRQTMI